MEVTKFDRSFQRTDDARRNSPKRLAGGILCLAKIALLHCFPLCSFETQKLETPAPIIRSRWFHLPVFLTGHATLLGALMYCARSAGRDYANKDYTYAVLPRGRNHGGKDSTRSGERQTGRGRGHFGRVGSRRGCGRGGARAAAERPAAQDAGAAAPQPAARGT